MDVIYSFSTSRFLAQMIDHCEEGVVDFNEQVLLDALLRPEILECFLIYYARKINELPYELECEDLSTLSVVYDRHSDIFYHLLLLLDRRPQYIQHLGQVVNRPELLFSDYHLDITNAFALLRSILDIKSVLTNDSIPDFANVNSESFEAVLKGFYPKDVWNTLDYRAFLSFWMLRYSDFQKSSACYSMYRKRLDSKIEKKEKEKSTLRSERTMNKQIIQLKHEREQLDQDESSIDSHIRDINVPSSSYLHYRMSPSPSAPLYSAVPMQSMGFPSSSSIA